MCKIRISQRLRALNPCYVCLHQTSDRDFFLEFSMNQLIAMSSEMTMGTKEIADLLGKNHSDIKRSAERLQESGVIGVSQPLAESQFTNGQGREFMEYRIGKLDSITLVAQNCPQFTAALVKRWDELERGAANQKIPQTYAAALLEAGRLALELEKSQEQLAIAAPKAEFVDRYVDSSGTYGFRQAAKMLDIKESDFRTFLLDNAIMYRLGGKLTAYANHIEAG